MSTYTLTQAAKALTNGAISSDELTKNYLERVKSVDSKVKAFLSIDEEYILNQAKASDLRRSKGETLSDFDGVPIVMKDNIAVKDLPCTCASKILEKFVSPYDATVTKRLKEKGMVMFGRANMDEFAMGSSCENSGFQKTCNPWDLERVPGGSSGGSAAAVASLQAPVALGSDTGGSIRQPAAFCGVAGLKPTYGRISRYGLVAFASSLDQIGPLAHDSVDLAAILDIISGNDPLDSTSLPDQATNILESIVQTTPDDLKGVKIGLPKEYFSGDGLSPEIAASMTATQKALENAGAQLVEVSLPRTEYAIATYYIIATAEASANLARFDGIRYGARTEHADDLMKTYFETRGNGFGEEVKRRIILGTYALSSGYYDAYYLRAQKVRTLIRQDFEKAHEACDLILTPVSPCLPFKFGEKSNPLQMYLSDIFTIAVNLAGNCAVSVPASIDAATGLPIGVQFVGPAMGEEKLLRISRAFEQIREQKEFIPNL